MKKNPDDFSTVIWPLQTLFAKSISEFEQVFVCLIPLRGVSNRPLNEENEDHFFLEILVMQSLFAV